MIELWNWPTPNGQKINIAVEELGLPYSIHPVNIGKGEQLTPEFLALNPNHRIPAIIDEDGPGGERLVLFESGAILIYLAEKTGRLMPTDAAARYLCLQWLMFQMAGVGPMYGQYNHFKTYAPEKLPYAIDRYTNEANRLLRVLDKRLAATPYLAGAEYSIADIATYPWIHAGAERGLTLEAVPAVQRWAETVAARPGVQRGMALMSEHRPPPQQVMSDEQRAILFGATQHAVR